MIQSAAVSPPEKRRYSDEVVLLALKSQQWQVSSKSLTRIMSYLNEEKLWEQSRIPDKSTILRYGDAQEKINKAQVIQFVQNSTHLQLALGKYSIYS